MNAITQGDTEAPSLVALIDIIELKRLLAGHGVRLHVEKLQADREYARHVLDHAATAPNAALLATVCRVRRGLGLDGA